MQLLRLRVDQQRERHAPLPRHSQVCQVMQEKLGCVISLAAETYPPFTFSCMSVRTPEMSFLEYLLP